jgi:hypothetical protein
MKSLTNVTLSAVVVTLLASFTASAQPTAPAPAPVAAPVVVTAELKAAIAEMLDAINFKQILPQMGAAMAQSFPQMIEQRTAQSTEKLTAEEQAKLRAETNKSMQSSFPKMIAIYSDPDVIKGMEDIMARSYAKRFTLAEIKTIAAFYKSDAGKKMQSMGPQLMQESMPEIMALVSPRMNMIIESIAKEAKEAADKIAATNATKTTSDAKK